MTSSFHVIFPRHLFCFALGWRGFTLFLRLSFMIFSLSLQLVAFSLTANALTIPLSFLIRLPLPALVLPLPRRTPRSREAPISRGPLLGTERARAVRPRHLLRPRPLTYTSLHAQQQVPFHPRGRRLDDLLPCHRKPRSSVMGLRHTRLPCPPRQRRRSPSS